MLCGDCTAKTTAKELVAMATEKNTLLSAEYLAQKTETARKFSKSTGHNFTDKALFETKEKK